MHYNDVYLDFELVFSFHQAFFSRSSATMSFLGCRGVELATSGSIYVNSVISIIVSRRYVGFVHYTLPHICIQFSVFFGNLGWTLLKTRQGSLEKRKMKMILFSLIWMGLKFKSSPLQDGLQPNKLRIRPLIILYWIFLLDNLKSRELYPDKIRKIST